MIVFIALFLAWVIITLIGHVSWLAVAALFQALFGDHSPPTAIAKRSDDAAASNRVISRMAAAMLISPQDAQRLRHKIRQLDGQTRRAPTRDTAQSAPAQSPSVWSAPASPAAGVSPTQSPVVKRQPMPPTAPAQANAVDPDVRDAPDSLPARGWNQDHAGDTAEPVMAEPVMAEPVPPRQQTLNEFLSPPPGPVAAVPVAASGRAPAAGKSPVQPSAPVPAAATVGSAARSSARASAGKSLAEFLAEHNIRWGELLAGLMIVACSIGLVVSLWSTLAGMHRVIPSLIFMSANAAIFGAGFYTLFRWRTQDTSRATLVIATLLVPLGILAGLSTSGIDPTAVALDDPITVLSILAVGAVYVGLIWQASRALVGSSNTIPMTLGVAGPAAVLPFVLAAIRAWQASSGFVVYAGSIAVVAALSWMILRRREISGAATGRRAMILGVIGFSLATLAGYVAFLLRSMETGWLSIATATLPGVVMLAAAASSLNNDTKRPKFGLAGSVFASFGLFAASVLLVPMMVSMGWLWTWAISFSAAAAVAAYVVRSPRWTVIATLPIGLAFMLSSPAIVADVIWTELPVWKRMLGGEPMLAAMVVGLVGLALAAVIRSADQRKAMLLASGGWLAYATVNAAILTVAPTSLMGVVHPWVLSAMLGVAGVAVVAIAALRSFAVNPNWIAGVGTSILFAFWISVIKPVVIGQSFPGLEPSLLTVLATACCVILSAEFVMQRKPIATSFRSFGSAFLFGGSVTAILLLFANVSEPDIHSQQTQKVIFALSFSVFGWLWIGLTDRNELHLGLARVFLVVTAIVSGHHFFHDSLMTVPAWRSGVALWAWSGLGWSVVAVIGAVNLAIRSIGRLEIDSSSPSPSRNLANSLAKRLGWYRPDQQPWDIASAAAIVGFSTIFLALASILAFGSLVFSVGLAWEVDINAMIGLPIAVLAVSGLILHWRGDHASKSILGWTVLGRVHLASVFAWLGWQLAIRLLVDPSEQLVLTTSFATACCFAMDLMRREVKQDPKETRAEFTASDGLLTAIGLTLVAVSSGALLTGGWLPLIREGLSPDLFTTVSVAVWWTAAAITSGWLGHRYRLPALARVSAVLVPAVVFLVMPLWVPGDWWVWVQTAAIASGVFAIALRISGHWKATRSNQPTAVMLQPAIDLSMAIGVGIGVSSCIAVIAGVLFSESHLMQLHNPAGVILAALSATMIVLWNRIAGQSLRSEYSVSWPATASLMSGHLAILLMHFAIPSMGSRSLLSVVWTGVAVLEIVRFCRDAMGGDRSDRFGRWHAGALIIGATALCQIDGTVVRDWSIGLTACVAGLVLVTVRSIVAHWEHSRGIETPKSSGVVARGWSWCVGAMGAVFVAEIVDATSGSDALLWTMLMAWVGSWAIVWRVICPDRPGKESGAQTRRAMLSDSEAAVFVLAALAVESVMVVTSPSTLIQFQMFGDPLLWIRLGFGVALAVSMCTRHHRTMMAEVGLATALVTVTLLGLRIGVNQMVEPTTMLTIVCLTMASAFAVIVFSAGSVCRAINWVNGHWTGLIPSGPMPSVISVERFGTVLIRVVVLPGIVVLGASSWLLLEYNSDRIVPVAICGVALLAAALAELAERTGREIVRHQAVVIALVSIAMWSSFDVAGASMPLLALSTRWFVGWVLIGGCLAFVLPKLLGGQLFGRWKLAIRSGLGMALALAVGSLVATLLQEGMVRVSGQTDLLDKPLYLGMAATLALMSLLCTLGSILSGPGFSYRDAWQLTDRQRTTLVIAAQVFGGLTWFHLFLCKSPLASLGLRAYWPYVVMTLAFFSVGITEWARRRGDELLTKTLKQTALFLPLIPVIGFWLSGSWVTSLFGSSDGSGWHYIQGRVSYQALLVAAALYYGVISFLWKSTRARLVSIVVGNLALWVFLVQNPDWGFLTHPQAWTIPPAICVLIATHLHRESLGKSTAAGIRYAATLTIYITSTADMLIQGVGSTIWGPIVLIVFALLGAGAGVALRVKPFLYLGTTFVFIGVTSMVWHAQEQMDAVWPWWVFGITTGVMLMVGLMAIEKNKPKLRRIAMSMQQWDT